MRARENPRIVRQSQDPAHGASPADQGSASSLQDSCRTMTTMRNPSPHVHPAPIPVTTSTTLPTRIKFLTMTLDARYVRAAVFRVRSRRLVAHATSATTPSMRVPSSSSGDVQDRGRGHQLQPAVPLPLALPHSQPAQIPPGPPANARRAVQVRIQPSRIAADKVSYFLFITRSTH